MSNDKANTAEKLAPAAKTTERTIRWDDTNMRTSYANVCNVSSTREELTLLFGTNQTWDAGQSELKVSLSDRIMLSPFAAKRLTALLSATLDKYEETFGPLTN